jgi:hypothetical protein
LEQSFSKDYSELQAENSKLNEDVSYLTSELLSLQKEVEISSALLT